MKAKFPKLKNGEPHTLETIKARCIEEGDCLLWQGGKRDGRPTLQHEGQSKSVRAYIAVHLQKRRLSGRVVTERCGCLDCVNPSHFAYLTPAELGRRTEKRSLHKMTPVYRQKVSAGKQRSSKLDWDKVREIRASSEPTKAIALKMGTSTDNIISIRNHRTWREPSPFYGLFSGLVAGSRRAA